MDSKEHKDLTPEEKAIIDFVGKDQGPQTDGPRDQLIARSGACYG